MMNEAHYRKGSVGRRSPFETRLWQRIKKTETCWEWLGSKLNGYGILIDRGVKVYAHRAVYELTRQPIPANQEIDHLCRNRGCVNPEHLEVVTTRENVLRGTGPSAVNKRKTHCKNGHSLTGTNLKIVTKRDGTSYRRCMKCWRQYQRDYYQRHGR